MESKKITCVHCNSAIVIRYDEKYGGSRGRCDACKTDFPLG